MSFDMKSIMTVLFVSDVNDILNTLTKYNDTKSTFIFSLTTYEDLLDQTYHIGYFYINSDNFTNYDSVYHLPQKIVSVFHDNIRKYILSVDLIIVPLSSNLFVKIKKSN
jgi:hypothetical protein